MSEITKIYVSFDSSPNDESLLTMVEYIGSLELTNEAKALLYKNNAPILLSIVSSTNIVLEQEMSVNLPEDLQVCKKYGDVIFVIDKRYFKTANDIKKFLSLTEELIANGSSNIDDSLIDKLIQAYSINNKKRIIDKLLVDKTYRDYMITGKSDKLIKELSLISGDFTGPEYNQIFIVSEKDWLGIFKTLINIPNLKLKIKIWFRDIIALNNIYDDIKTYISSSNIYNDVNHCTNDNITVHLSKFVMENNMANNESNIKSLKKMVSKFSIETIVVFTSEFTINEAVLNFIAENYKSFFMALSNNSVINKYTANIVNMFIDNIDYYKSIIGEEFYKLKFFYWADMGKSVNDIPDLDIIKEFIEYLPAYYINNIMESNLIKFESGKDVMTVGTFNNFMRGIYDTPAVVTSEYNVKHILNNWSIYLDINWQFAHCVLPVLNFAGEECKDIVNDIFEFFLNNVNTFTVYEKRVSDGETVDFITSLIKEDVFGRKYLPLLKHQVLEKLLERISEDFKDGESLKLSILAVLLG